MSCSCIDVDHDSMPSFLRESIVKARKHHYCGECRRVIEPGDEYEYVFGIWEGSSSVYKTCPDCLSVRNEYFCGRWFYGMVWENAQECIYENLVYGNSLCLGLDGLTSKARLDMIEYIDEVLEDEDG